MRTFEPWTGAAAVARQWRTQSFGARPWQLRWQPVCASTELEMSTWLQEKPLPANQPRALFADRQTHGRGQRGRIWQAPTGGVWISAALPWTEPHRSAGIWGLAVAVALAERLERRGVPVRIKWPNDLLVGERKLAGLLPRLVHRGSSVRFARIGLGLNVCNRVPREGIALLEMLRPGQCDPLIWTAEVLWALDRAMALVVHADLVLAQAKSRLWAKQVRDPKGGELWEVIGFGLDGSLSLQQGSQTTSWSRWG